MVGRATYNQYARARWELVGSGESLWEDLVLVVRVCYAFPLILLTVLKDMDRNEGSSELRISRLERAGLAASYGQNGLQPMMKNVSHERSLLQCIWEGPGTDEAWKVEVTSHWLGRMVR